MTEQTPTPRTDPALDPPADATAHPSGGSLGGGVPLGTLFGGGLLVIAVVIALAVVLRPVAQAGTPAVFRAGPVAQVVADAGGRPVVAVYTASWCGPCQAYKGGALADPKVTAWLEANAVPVLIDVDEFPEDARAANVSSIPMTAVIEDGEVIAARTGASSAGELLTWLERSTSN